MRFLLVSPQTEFRVRPLNVWTPLGIISIAASLKEKGHEVAFFDRHALSVVSGLGKKRTNEMLAAKVLSFKPDVIGFNTLSPLIYDTVECVSLIRPLFPGFMIAGGASYNSSPRREPQKNQGPERNRRRRGRAGPGAVRRRPEPVSYSRFLVEKPGRDDSPHSPRSDRVP